MQQIRFDPERRAQDARDRLGKLLSTPVEGEPRWRVELIGLRNPWRFAFDPALGEIWVADVGQDEIEEVNRVLLEPDEPPKNLRIYGASDFAVTKKTIDTHPDYTEHGVFGIENVITRLRMMMVAAGPS